MTKISIMFFFIYLDINECEEQEPPCFNGGTCKNIDGDYECDCTSTGWQGKNCTVGKCINS